MNIDTKEVYTTGENGEIFSSADITAISRVILFNDKYHTFNQVVNQLKKALGCCEEIAFSLTYNIHKNSNGEVFRGNISDCIRVSSVLRDINLKTQILT